MKRENYITWDEYFMGVAIMAVGTLLLLLIPGQHHYLHRLQRSAQWLLG